MWTGYTEKILIYVFESFRTDKKTLTFLYLRKEYILSLNI